MITCEHYPSLPPFFSKDHSQHFLPTTKARQPQAPSCRVLSQLSSPARLLLGAVCHIPSQEQADNLIPAEFNLLSTLPKHSLLACFATGTKTAKLTETVQFPPTTCATAQEEGDSGMKGQHIQSKAKDLQFDSSVS